MRRDISLAFRGKWELVVAIALLTGWLIPAGIWLCVRTHPYNFSALWASVGGLVLCAGTLYYQRMHALRVYDGCLHYRSPFHGWRCIPLDLIVHTRCEIGYGDDMMRTHIVARLYLLGSDNNVLGIINFGAFKREDIALLLCTLKNAEPPSTVTRKSRTRRDIEREMKAAASLFMGQLLRIALVLLGIWAIVSLIKRIIN